MFNQITIVCMLPIILSASTFVSTLLGGYVAIKNVKRLNNILGYTAGVLLGVVAFGLLPEIFELTSETGIDITWPMIALTVGFLAFHILEKSILMHHHNSDAEHGSHTHPHVGIASAIAIMGHSFLDGMAIGIGFQAGNEIGIAVAVAVIAHNFSDGLNTVSLLLHHKNEKSRAIKFLLANAIAPVLGAASTLFFTVPATVLVVYLSFFAGFLLYIGASDILPQAHSKGSSRTTIGLTILGVLTMYIVTHIAHV